MAGSARPPMQGPRSPSHLSLPALLPPKAVVLRHTPSTPPPPPHQEPAAPKQETEDAQDPEAKWSRGSRKRTLKGFAKLKATLLRHASFVGPGVIASVAYIDPGNWSTDLAAGSQVSRGCKGGGRRTDELVSVRLRSLVHYSARGVPGAALPDSLDALGYRLWNWYASKLSADSSLTRPCRPIIALPTRTARPSSPQDVLPLGDALPALRHQRNRHHLHRHGRAPRIRHCHQPPRPADSALGERSSHFGRRLPYPPALQPVYATCLNSLLPALTFAVICRPHQGRHAFNATVRAHDWASRARSHGLLCYSARQD